MNLEEMGEKKLRVEAKNRGLKQKGPKSELLARIREHDAEKERAKGPTCAEPGCTKRPNMKEHGELCSQHLHEAELENAHTDFGHDNPVKDCPLCPAKETRSNPGPGRRGYLSVSLLEACDAAVQNALPAARRLIKEEEHKTAKQRREALFAVAAETMSEAAHTGKPVVVKELSERLTAWEEEEGRPERAKHHMKIIVRELKKEVEAGS